MAAIPPRAAERPHLLVHHGRERTDPFYWLRADDWQAVMRDPGRLPEEIRRHLEAENAFTDAVLADTAALQKTLMAEMRGRIKEDDSGVPEPDGPFAYYWRYDRGGQHEIYCRRPREGTDETILLHGDREAEGQSYFHVGNFVHSPDHRYAAYAVDLNGAEYYTIRIRDLEAGVDLPDAVPNARGDIVWAADSRTFLYTRLDPHHRPNQVYLHRLGNAAERDKLLYDERDPAFYVSVGATESRRFLLITAHDHNSSEVRFLSADAPEARPMVVAPRTPHHEYEITDHGDHFLILTNCQGAEDFKIVSAPIGAPTQPNWRDWVAHEPGRLILGLTLFRRHLVRMERVDALPRLVVTALGPETARGAEHIVAFPEEAYSLGILPGYEYDTQTLRFTYSSPTTPQQTFSYDLETRARHLLKTQEVPSGHDPSAYVVRRIEAKAHDGERIPVTLLHRRGLALDGRSPLLLYGYGAYGISIPAAFSTNRLSLVDRGVVYAIAHVRGGKDKGFRWYRQGKMLEKRNTFEDFIAAARHLCIAGYTAPGRIVAHGGSAGGLLMGAVANMAPDLWAGVVAEVPFVDTLTTILDASLPLTPPEWTEWGNPIEDPAVYDYMASYSPYDNVAGQAYPPVLALAGLTDPRVTYWEPAKWIAKLRLHKTDANPALLKVNMDAGHAGAAGRFNRLEEVALVYAFALRVTGRAA